ncbi:MAG: hypothetical protein IJS60_04270 [Abditibacteriota bacterium]|nr:hypothetical protein [Abditibacteriota bacterium]
MNPKAFEKMVGFTSAGSPLVDVLKKHSGLKKADITSTLRHASLIGENPTRTAQKMVKAGYDDMGHALLVARRSTMRVAQEVGNENFKKNGVEYVQWVSGETAYTCAACWAMSGRVFEVGKAPHDHPNGRCVFNPYLPELAELDPDLYKHDPEENFAKLSEEEQREILGPAKFEAWKRGELSLSEMVTTTTSDKYGTSIKIKPLEDLGLDKSGKNDYNNSGLFRRGGASDTDKLSAETLQTVKEILKKKGILVELEGEHIDFLRRGGVLGSCVNEATISLTPDADLSTLCEEVIHALQYKFKGQDASTKDAPFEIEAGEFLLKLSDIIPFGENELEHTRSRLNSFGDYMYDFDNEFYEEAKAFILNLLGEMNEKN